MDDQQPPEYAYHVLRGAVERFQKGVVELNDQELRQVCRQADKTYELESAVLASPEALGLVVAEADVKAAVEELAGRYESYDAFIEDLQNNGVSEEALQSALHRELLFDAVMNKVASRAATISDLDVQLFYQMQIERFSLPEVRSASHLLITVNDEYEENRRSNVLKRIEEIQQELLDEPGRFKDLVLRHSECPTAMQGGVLGKVKPGTLYPELEEVLFQMQEGELSGIVESELGFHILHCTGIEEAREVPLSEAKHKIRPMLEERQRRNCQKAWLAELKRSSS